MKDGLQACYDDVEHEHGNYEHGNLRIELEERRMWKLIDDAEFANFFNTVCQLPHVQQLLEKCSDLDLPPHSIGIVYKKLKNTLRAMVWQNLGNCADQMFLKENSQPVLEFNAQQLVTMQCNEKRSSLDKWFSLHF